ncbi:MAG: hypothetical protein KDB60_09215 [Propionibacteriaceae bacterium]|nr:hypothetical protein [Propionibacteriaceae bacterium]
MTTLSDLLRRETFLNRFSWHAQDYPGYVKVKRDLRRELTAAARDAGMPAAIASLGHPAELAAEYLAGLEHPRPRWSTALWWLAAGVWTLGLLALAYALGTMDTLEALGGGSVQHDVFGTPVLFTYTAEEISSQFRLTWASLAWLVGFAALPYLVGARFWRLWTGRRPATASRRSGDAVGVR